LENAIVIGNDGYMNDLRFPDELVRHKVLDLIGDMALVGTPFTGHVIGVASGHALHATLAQAIQKQFKTNL
jgi:UDP-3-O-[3-hydroxymyristoyl] N-acetylglucosamine deacetylase